MSKTTPKQNKALVLEAFDTLFNKRDYEAAKRYWSDCYIQHSAHIAPGRDGLFDLVRTLPDTSKYENHTVTNFREKMSLIRVPTRPPSRGSNQAPRHSS
jgi:predicted SnoaL-like aldol condensation-catalyzing enzyme